MIVAAVVSHAVAMLGSRTATAAAMPPASISEAFVAIGTVILEAVTSVILPLRDRLRRLLALRLCTGDERRQAIDIAVTAVRPAVVVVIVVVILPGLMLRLVAIELGVAGHVGLRVARAELRLLTADERRFILSFVIIAGAITRVVSDVLHLISAVRTVIAVERWILPELLLRGGDHAKIVFGVLIVAFGADRITRRLRITRKLNVFFRDV